MILGRVASHPHPASAWSICAMSSSSCRLFGFALFILPALFGACSGGDGPPASGTSWTDLAKQREAAIGHILDRVRVHPAELSTLLTAMPKGADLHSHLSGAIATENLIA